MSMSGQRSLILGGCAVIATLAAVWRVYKAHQSENTDEGQQSRVVHFKGLPKSNHLSYDELTTLCSRWGEVVRCLVLKKRGQGLVEMRSPEMAAALVEAGQNGALTVRGRSILASLSNHHHLAASGSSILSPSALTTEPNPTDPALYSLYPQPPPKDLYCPGDRVVVQAKGPHTWHGVVVDPTAYPCKLASGVPVLRLVGAGSAPPQPARIARLRPSKLIRLAPRLLAPQCHVLVCSETPQYRRIAAAQARDTDFALEIGSDFGACTKLLSDCCQHVVGVDKALSHVEAARQLHPGITFIDLDPLLDPAKFQAYVAQQEAQVNCSLSLVCIDINGNRELVAVQALLRLVLALYHGRELLVVVKSRAMFNHVRAKAATSGSNEVKLAKESLRKDSN